MFPSSHASPGSTTPLPHEGPAFALSGSCCASGTEPADPPVPEPSLDGCPAVAEEPTGTELPEAEPPPPPSGGTPSSRTRSVPSGAHLGSTHTHTKEDV